LFAGGDVGANTDACIWVFESVDIDCESGAPGPDRYEIFCGDFEYQEWNGSGFEPSVFTGGLLTEAGVFEALELIGQWQHFNGSPDAPSGSIPYETIDCCSPTIGSWQDLASAISGFSPACDWTSSTLAISGTCFECS
jgi:hypothetical protein